MRKTLLFISILLLLSGCTKINSGDNDYINYVNSIVFSNKKYTNSVSIGYKYYIPKGVIVVEDNDFNIMFSIDDEYLYLYVDAVSYHYKNNTNFEKENVYDYYKIIKNGNKRGYIAVNKDNDKYYVRLVYNYSKIEFYTTEEKLPKFITLSSIILNNIDYNKIVIEKLLENNSSTNGEIKYQIDDLKESKNSFSQYLNEYVKEEESKKLPDE